MRHLRTLSGEISSSPLWVQYWFNYGVYSHLRPMLQRRLQRAFFYLRRSNIAPDDYSALDMIYESLLRELRAVWVGGIWQDGYYFQGPIAFEPFVPRKGFLFEKRICMIHELIYGQGLLDQKLKVLQASELNRPDPDYDFQGEMLGISENLIDVIKEKRRLGYDPVSNQKASFWFDPTYTYGQLETSHQDPRASFGDMCTYSVGLVLSRRLAVRGQGREDSGMGYVLERQYVIVAVVCDLAASRARSELTGRGRRQFFTSFDMHKDSRDKEETLAQSRVLNAISRWLMSLYLSEGLLKEVDRYNPQYEGAKWTKYPDRSLFKWVLFCMDRYISHKLPTLEFWVTLTMFPQELSKRPRKSSKKLFDVCLPYACGPEGL